MTMTLAELPIVCVGFHPWSPMWKRNQSMMAECARQGLVERLVFLNPEVTAMTSPMRIRRECRTIRRFSYAGVRASHPEPRTTVTTPVHWVPFRGRAGWLRRLDRHLLVSGVDRALDGRRPYVLLVNSVRPESRELIDLLWDDACLRVFDWSDDFSKFPLDARAREDVARATDAMLERVDLVLAVNDNLAERARKKNARVATVINATNMAPRLDQQLSKGARALGETLTRPVIGYAGFINEHRVDLDLVVDLARRHPEATIVFLGPIQLDFDRRFPDLPNIRFVPPVEYVDLQDYLMLFDVCMIPHLDNPHTAGNNPLKLYDYLTTGRPVVTTRIAGLEGFDDVVSVASDHDAFINAIERAIDSDTDAACRARIERARSHHWSVRARDTAEIISGALDAVGSRHDARAVPTEKRAVS